MQEPRPDPLDSEQLLEHLDWVRALAGRLVGDPTVADDLTQEACLAALRGPAPGVGSERGWLGKVVENLVRRLGRENARRRAREEAVAREEASERGPEEWARAVESQRRLAACVLALDEPYRSTLLERYWEGRTPAEIAARTSTKVATVKTRLRRAHELLRGELRSERRDWAGLVLMAKMGGTSRWGRARTPRARTLGGPGSVAALAAALLLVAVLQREPRAPGLEALLANGPTASAPVSGPAVGPAPVSTAARERRAASKRSSVSPVPPPRQRIDGRVVDALGHALAGVEVGFFPGLRHGAREDVASRAATDHRGRFELDALDVDGSVRVVAGDVVGVLHALVRGGLPDRSALLVAAPRGTTVGRVQDVFGRPVAHAQVAWRFGEMPAAARDAVLDENFDPRFEATTDATGTFHLDGPLWTASGRPQLDVTCVGFRGARFSLPRDVFVLERRGPLRAERSLLTGDVRDVHGRPQPGVWVGTGDTSTRTDALGRFELEHSSPAGSCLRAVGRGWRPARDLVPEAPRPGEAAPFLALVLEQPALTVRGTVVSADGAPVPSARVRLVAGEGFGPALGEHLLASGRSTRSVEELAGGEPDARFVVADEAGRFELAGLSRNHYALQAVDPNSLAEGFAGARGGEHGVCIRLDPASVRSAVRGRVVDRAGTPLRGIEVSAGRAKQGHLPTLAGVPQVTDDQGRFEFPALVGGRLQLVFDGGPSWTLRREWVEVPSARERTVVLHRELHFRIATDLDADQARFLDEHGDPLPVTHTVAGMPRSGSGVRLIGGRTRDVFSVDDRAYFLQLRRGDSVAAELPVILRPDGITEIVVPDPTRPQGTLR